MIRSPALRKRLRRRAAAENGFALALSLGTMVVLLAALAAVIAFTSSGARQAPYSKVNQTAFALAEAGINNAMAVLSKPSNNALVSTTLPPPAPSTSARTDTYEDGSVTWGGTLSGSTWTITAIGKAQNPTGAGGSVQRKLTATVTVVSTLTQPLNNQAWNYIFATRTGSLCDMSIVNSVSVDASLYVSGNLCLDNTATIQKSSNPSESTILVVRGKLSLIKAANAVGASGANIAEAHVVNGCQWQTNPTHNPCSSADNVWANLIDSSATAITTPAADFAYWYDNATLGPMASCTTQSGTPPTFENETTSPTRNNSVGTVNLTPASSYTCQRWVGSDLIGELSWNASTKVLTVKGAIYVDGSATISNNAVNNYDGQASLYLSGTFSISGTSELCGGVAAGHCDFASWNPNTEMLAIVADGNDGFGNSIVIANSTRFQGSLYGTNALKLMNSAQADGPMVASTVILENSVQTHAFPQITTVPIGMPGNPNVYAQPQPPGNYSG